MQFPISALLGLLPFLIGEAAAQASGTGSTTRYWDCCKPSCAWPKKASLVGGPVGTCDKSDNKLNDGGNTKSACDNGGGAYMCSGHAPWAVNETVAYGWAAVRVNGQNEGQWCCACYELTFTGGPIQGKKLIVQATNTGGDLGQNHFDLAVRFALLGLAEAPARNSAHEGARRGRGDVLFPSRAAPCEAEDRNQAKSRLQGLTVF